MEQELEAEVVNSLKNGRKIEAIKKLRELRGIGLKEAKDIVDAYSAEHNISPSVVEVKPGNGMIGLIILAVIFFIAYRYFSGE